MMFNIEDKYKDSSGIYIITNINNGKCYVGSTKNFSKRYKQHNRGLKDKNHFNNKLLNSYLKYGKNCFEFTLLALVENLEDLFALEFFYIENLKPQYNIRLTSEEFKKSYVNSTFTNEYIRRGKLQEEDVIGIILMINDDFSNKEIVKEYDIKESIVQDIRSGKIYTHLSHLFEPPIMELKDKLIELEKIKIIKKLQMHYTIEAVAKMYSLPIKYVRRIVIEFNRKEIASPFRIY